MFALSPRNPLSPKSPRHANRSFHEKGLSPRNTLSPKSFFDQSSVPKIEEATTHDTSDCALGPSFDTVEDLKNPSMVDVKIQEPDENVEPNQPRFVDEHTTNRKTSSSENKNSLKSKILTPVLHMESVFRKRSPGSGIADKISNGWWIRSPRTAQFRMIKEHQQGLIGISEEMSEDESLRQTIGLEDIDKQIVPQPTPLHLLCLAAAHPDDLWKEADLATPLISSKIDPQGRLPLHCVSYNSALMDNIAFGNPEMIGMQDVEIQRPVTTENIEFPMENRLISFLIEVLIQACPVSVISSDINGMIPFEGALSEWVNQSMTLSDQSDSANSRERFASIWTRLMKNLGKRNRLMAAKEEVSYYSPKADIENAKLSQTKSQEITTSNFRLTASSYFSFKILSAIIDCFDQHQNIYQNSTSRRNPKVFDMSAEIVRRIASIPRLLHVVLLLDDKDQRNFVLSTSVMKRILCCRNSVGNWLTEMLRSPDKKVADHGIEYFQIVSKQVFNDNNVDLVNESPYGGKDGDSRRVDENDREGLATEMSNLEGFVPTLLSLNERHMEEASATKVVRRVVDKVVSRPFCVTVLFCEAFFLAILITGFRLAVNHLIIGSPSRQVLKCLYLANIGLFYFIERELGRAVAFFSLTKQARSYFFSFWYVTDLISTFLVIASLVAIRRRLGDNEPKTDMVAIRNLLAATTGFLWLRVLSFLKGTNIHLATCVQAVVQVARDVVWFCSIISILVIAFSQMFFTVLAPTSCSKEGTCKQAEYFLSTYALSVFQDFEREKFTTVFSALLVVVYSVLVLLVMMNVLIAVASDSYDKCLVGSENSFGQARVTLIAELVCFQNLLRRNTQEQHPSAQLFKGRWSSKWRNTGWSRASIVYFGLAITILLGWIIGELVLVSARPKYGSLQLSSIAILLIVGLFIGTWALLTNESHKQLRLRYEQGRVFFCGGWLQAILHGLGSFGPRSSLSPDWKGKLLYLKNEVARVSEEKSLNTEEKLKTLEKNLLEDIDDLRKCVASLRDDLKPAKNDSNATLAKVLVTLHELERKIGSNPK